MPINCKSGGHMHQHATVAEVRACYGNAPQVVTPVGTHSRPARDRDIPPQPQGGSFNNGGRSMLPDTGGMITANQAKYLTDLLGHAKLASDGTWKVEGLTKQAASYGINQVKAYLARTGPVPPGCVHVGEPTPTVAANGTREPYPDVPAGHYATRSATGNNDLDFWRVDRPTEGRWAGRTFVKRVIGGKADSPVRGATALAALKAILANDIGRSRVLYGREIGRCWKCNRHLTDEVSRSLGIGPDCRSRAS
jgi:hypothetical protein